MKLDCYSQTLQQERALQNNEPGKFQTVTRVIVERRAACYVSYIGVFWVAYQIFGRRFWRQFLSVDPREWRFWSYETWQVVLVSVFT